MKRSETLSYLACSESALRTMIKRGVLKQSLNGREILDQSIYELTKNAKEIYTVSGAAELLDVDNKTILNMVESGQLDSFKIGSGKGNSGLRIIDINSGNKNDKPKASNKKTKETTPSRVVVKKISVDGVDVLVSIQGNQDQVLTKLYKNFLKAWVEGSDLEDKLLKLKELIGKE